MRFLGRLTLANWTQVSDRCPLGYLLYSIFLIFEASSWLSSLCSRLRVTTQDCEFESYWMQDLFGTKILVHYTEYS